MRADLETIKETVPVTYVFFMYGHDPVDLHGSDILYRSPFRADQNPSIACYASGDGVVDRWRDMAMGEGGDIFDLIQRFDPSLAGFSDTLLSAQDLYERFVGDNWVAPVPAQVKGTLDIEAVREEFLRRSLDEVEAGLPDLDEWLWNRNDALKDVEARWLADIFQVYWKDDRIIIPYLDRDGDLVITKYRRPGEKAMSLAGSRGMYTHLYGEHLDTDPSRPVVLCEGESDVWSGTHATQKFVFLGLPSGAGYSEKLTPRLADRRVLIALDGDEAGRGNTVRWAQALADTCQVEVVHLPDGKDLSDVQDIPRLLDQSRRFESRLPGLMVIGDCYVGQKANGDPGRPISDFSLTVTKVLRERTGAYSYEVEIEGDQHLLLWHELRSKNTLTSWANERGYAWLGSDSDVQLLANNLKADSIFVPMEEGYDIAGLHEGHFVWPGGKIGDRDVRWVPGREGVEPGDFTLGDDTISLHEAGDVIQALLDLNLPKTIDPILAWLFAAPLRSQVVEFPILNLSGSSGTGKTATIETVVPIVSGIERGLGLSTQPTKYAISSLLSSTNAFPISLDEYRPSRTRSSDETLGVVDDLLRAAYNSQARETGGAPGNPMKKIKSPVSAPIIVSGESTLAEDSLRQRAIMVRLLVEGRDEKAMKYLKRLNTKGFALLYLSWVTMPPSRERPDLLEYEYGPEDLPPRMRKNLGILRQGWAMLAQFAFDVGINIRDPDFSGIVEEYQLAAETSPIRDALEVVMGLDKPRYGETVWIEDGMMHVMVEPFCQEAMQLGFVLPGNAAAVGKYLTETYGAIKHRIRRFGGRAWVSSMPAELVIGDEVQ